MAVSPRAAMRSGSSHKRISISFAEFLDVGNARDAFERVADVEVNIVAEKKAVVLAVFGIHARTEDEIARSFHDADAGSLHFIGEAAEGLFTRF